MPISPLTYKSKLNCTNGTWITVCWVEPNLLLTSSLWGELLSWDLSPNKDKLKHKLFHTLHNRGLFTIAAVPKYDAVSDDPRTDSELRVWSSAQDRWVICCKRDSDPTKSAILEYKIPTQGGYVYCMNACPIDTSRVAFGAGDAMLRLWNLSEPHATTFDIVMHWQKIKGKIRVVSWFPEDESTVAFGTGEGRVGVFDAIGTNKPPILYRQYHRNTIYKLEWAQLESEYYLFSCAEGELIAYQKSEPSAEPMSIIKKGCLEFSWKSNLCLAIALANGSIIFYDQKLRKRGNSIHFVRTMVNCLTWHPESTMADKSISPNANYLAAAFDSCNIMIFDMSKLIRELETTGTADVIENGDDIEERTMHKMVATLNGHVDKVVCLAWSPHFSGHLVSGSYDNTAQVWNVEKQELMGTYMGHDGPVLCCMWSPLKPQMIMTGSSDFTLHIWNYTLPAQSPKQASDIKAMKKKHKLQKKSAKSKTDDKESNSIAPTNQSAQVTTAKLESGSLKKKEKKYFSSKVTDRSQILNFIKYDIKSNQVDEGDALSIFSEKKEDFVTFFSNEKLAQDNLDVVTEMNMWCDDLKNDLISAANNGQLNDFLVSLAPSVSVKTWKEMCEAYAHQLVMQKHPEKAVSYLLAVHKIYEAIEVFFNAKMFKEAYALARCRLDADDPFLDKILESWAEWATYKGNLEQAAHCHVRLGHLDMAAKILSRRKDIHCLEVASELAFLNGDEGYGTSLVVDAVTRALVKSNWSKARSLIANIRQVQYLHVHIDAYEMIVSTFSDQTELDMMKTWLEGKEGSGTLQALGEKYGISNYGALRKKDDTNIVLKSLTFDKVMQVNISYQIAMAATCDAEETRLKHLTRALGSVDEFERTASKHGLTKQDGFFTHLLTTLDTKKPTDEDSIYARSDCPVSQSLRAYLCIGLMNVLWLHLKKLTIEEETQFVQLILDLLDDTINETNLCYQNNIVEHNKLEDKLMALAVETKDKMVENSDDYRDVKEDVEKLKLDINKFNEERVSIPDPNMVFRKACLIAGELKDDNNKFQLLQFLEKVIQHVNKFAEQELPLENLYLNN
ncbi:PREDICTED: gem-associated protein 5 isoform X2 [Vollenhovia emeryi]|nr:PREDICTED: gem-associated protein 5 isoform X2 [Vollenhovia emeryi]